ncbi:MAG: hypothetical protein KIT72_03700 [Polyangiaceae bacterium]|nr:hypothetical protein [Polyangiaceae bacterium]MCW5789506.1 hypothetical protein [Polyangiaceae bacterium]
MRTRVDDRLKAELAQFQLRYSCEHCAYFEPEAERCALGFPNDEHRALTPSSTTLVFCKEFELA